jgi:NADP-dependent 3-hydroxy acid dehydrogenase YdfG
MSQDRKIAWVTGGGSGIGLGAAQALAASGWTVILSGRRRDQLADATKTMPGAEIAALDVTNAAAVDQVAADLLARHGRIDLLVNSAGINSVKRSWADMTNETWDQVIDINLNGLLYCTRAVLPAMRAQKGGTVINVSSWAGRYPAKLTGPAYNASKQAVVALTHSLNMEECINGVRATAFCPGEVATPLLDKRPVPVSAEDKARMLQMEDCGSAIAYVANSPMHVCFNEILISPTWNRIFLNNPL